MSIAQHKSNFKISKELNVLADYNAAKQVNLASRMEVKKLIAENELLKKTLENKEKYKKTVDQAVHDIRTPLSVLLIGLKMCETLSEKERAIFRDSIADIQRIADEFLESTVNKEKKYDDQNILIDKVLLDIVNQKNIQYNNKNVELCLRDCRLPHSLDSSLHSACIYGNNMNFKRMMSNIINNSVEAFSDNKGTVQIKIFENDKNVIITIQDNGNGMSHKTVEKLMNGESVSSTKQGGYGIGTTQIQRIIREFKGKQFIESEQGVGTKITLTIPKLYCPCGSIAYTN